MDLIDRTVELTCKVGRMNDTISRQSAKELLKQNEGYMTDYDIGLRTDVIMDLLDDLSSVQLEPPADSEIIYCGQCRFKDDGIDEDGIPFLKCLHGRSYGETRINDFCSWAERRTDG